jgi:hypothetical protein
MPAPVWSQPYTALPVDRDGGTNSFIFRVIGDFIGAR